MKKRIFGILLSFALMLTMVPVLSQMAMAWDGNPYASLVDTTNVITFDGKAWYLIEDNSTAINVGTVTLLSKECVALSKYNQNSNDGNIYSDSTVEDTVNTYYTNSISADAKTAVSGGGMFLLTKAQASATTTDVRKSPAYPGNYSNCWWLCSPGSVEFNAAYVSGADGTVYENGTNVTCEFGVRPALKLDLSKVAFDSSTNTFSIPTPYPLWVGETQVTSANAGDILGNHTASYVAESNTLTLNGAKITKGHMVESCEYGIYYNGSKNGLKPLNIVLADGSVNTVEKEGDYDFEVGIIVDADWYGDHSGLNISGKGRLTASGSKYGIDANGNINVEGCDVRASGGNGAGIHSYDGSIVIRGGSVNASSTNDNAIVATEAVTIDGASVEASATDDNSIGILSYYSNVIIKAGSIVTASGDDQAIKCKYDGSVINYIDGTGWTDKDGSQGETAIPISTEGQTLTFKKVQFPAKVDKVTVEFNSAGGSPVASQTIAVGGKATKPADPTRDGYTFDGWYLGSTAFDFDSAIEKSITLTAHWKAAAQSTITYDLNGGTLNGETGIVTVKVNNGTEITLPSPTRDGYTFDYWEGSKYNAGDKYTVNGDHTFKAVWKTAAGGNGSKGGSSKKGVNTGDENTLGAWIVLIVAALAGTTGMAFARKRRDD